MVKSLYSLLVFLSCFSVVAQVTNEGTPASWGLTQKSSLSTISLPEVDIEKIRNEDAKRSDKLQTKRLRVGVLHKVNYGLDNGGIWTGLPNGDRIWRILFSSKDAVHLSVIFNKFYLPKGGKIYLYNHDKTDLLGAYTDTQNNEKQVLGTWLVMGEKVWVEYYEPKEVVGQARLNISSIIHGYRLGHAYQKGYLGNQQKALNSSGNCNHDVDCPIGADFESQRDLLKKSVAFLLMPDPNNTGSAFICTGTLVNNTAQDKTPYFLTANHCFMGTDPATYSMRFNWISPDPVCGAINSSTDAAENQTMSGTTLRATNALGDMMLVEINSAIPVDWDVTYAGWDRTTTTPSFVVGIHHPDGDIMKISRDDSGVTQATLSIGSQTSETWQITAEGGGWEIGVTEGGSSGSALFNQDGRVIGQLFGGSAECKSISNGTTDNGEADFYGRFATAWNGGGSNATQLRHWLDPQNTNPNTLDAIENILAVNDEFLEQNISLFPNPTSGVLQVKTSDLVGELEYEVFNVLGQKLTGNLINDNKIDISGLANNIYFIKMTEKDTNRSLVEKIILRK